MKLAKRLILGSAAALFAVGGAQAADLPLKAKAVEYVRICSLYGAGFYYIPGTDTCIKLGGYLRAEVNFDAGGSHTPYWSGTGGLNNRLRNDYTFRTRALTSIDTRTATEYGVVRTYAELVNQWTTGSDGVAGGTVALYNAFIQFAGFTFGKAQSVFAAPWNTYPGNLGSLLGGDDSSTAQNQISYTAQFGNGISGTLSLEDQSGYRTASLYNVTTATGTQWLSQTQTSAYGGTSIPDIVGRVRIDQAWGLFQVAAAAHQVRASYYNPASEISGHPDDKYGFAVQAALSLKNLPTGPGDSLNVSAIYTDGATKYVLFAGGPFVHYNSSDVAYQGLASLSNADGVFQTGGDIKTVTAWGMNGAFNHNWNPYWTTSLFGSYTKVDFGDAAGIYAAALRSTVGGTVTGSPNYNIAQIGTRTSWTPVKNLTFTGEVTYTNLDQDFQGVTGIVTPAGKPAANYEFKDQQIWSGIFRAQRNF
ncbi:porin [Rhodopseudomonas sp. BAL398]|nr:porin [Rhodopseudomonas sp. BAL398]WOK18615.1 porin [Rhodopseudomonas sp. BAL398]